MDRYLRMARSHQSRGQHVIIHTWARGRSDTFNTSSMRYWCPFCETTAGFQPCSFESGNKRLRPGGLLYGFGYRYDLGRSGIWVNDREAGSLNYAAYQHLNVSVQLHEKLSLGRTREIENAYQLRYSEERMEIPGSVVLLDLWYVSNLQQKGYMKPTR
jgi:hypothetical protein